jgi:hypothetical protein
MTDPALPAWEGDPLSTFLSQAQWNERVSALKLPDVYALLRGVHAAFQHMMTITERESNPNLLPSRFLMARAHAAWLAAVRMALSGQTPEAYPVIRTVIEHSWYALHLAKDPSPSTRAVIWLCRNDDAAAKARCKTEFAIANVRATHTALDAAAAAALQTLYDWTIELGAHPNERGVLAAMTRVDTGQGQTFGAVFLTDSAIHIAATLKTAIEAAVGALKAFRLIFPERFAIAGVDDMIEKLVSELNTVFAAYAVETRKRDGGR